MAQIVWTEPALNDLDAIADYIALESPTAAAELVRRVFAHVEQLAAHDLRQLRANVAYRKVVRLGAGKLEGLQALHL